MNITTGIDSIEIARIEKSMQSEAFIKRVYGKNEIKELEAKGFPPQSAAACFCVKEAFSKAIGTGIRGFELSEVETLHRENGKPYLSLSGNAEKIADGMNLCFDVSITHTDTAATAIVIAFSR